MSARSDAVALASGPLGAVLVIGAGALAVWWFFVRSKSPFNPENTAHDAAGNPVTAYKEVGGPLGWLGAAVNNATCGYPASIGEAIGRNLPVPADFSCYKAGFNAAMNCGVSVCQPTACSDPIHGVIHADKFKYPNGKRVPTNFATGEKSGSIQSWSARPHQAGNNAAYADAYENSPPDPTYTLNVIAHDSRSNYAGQ